MVSCLPVFLGSVQPCVDVGTVEGAHNLLIFILEDTFLQCVPGNEIASVIHDSKTELELGYMAAGGPQCHFLLSDLFPRAEMGSDPVYSWVDKSGFRTVVNRAGIEMYLWGLSPGVWMSMVPLKIWEGLCSLF